MAWVLSLISLSSSSYCLASSTMRSISSWVSLDLSLAISTDSEEPPSRSVALTLRMAFSSTSIWTSTWAAPRGAFLMPERVNLPRRRLSLVMARSPSKTWNSMEG